MAHIDIINHLDRSFQCECWILSMVHRTPIPIKPKLIVSHPSLEFPYGQSWGLKSQSQWAACLSEIHAKSATEY